MSEEREKSLERESSGARNQITQDDCCFSIFTQRGESGLSLFSWVQLAQFAQFESTHVTPKQMDGACNFIYHRRLPWGARLFPYVTCFFGEITQSWGGSLYAHQKMHAGVA